MDHRSSARTATRLGLVVALCGCIPSGVIAARHHHAAPYHPVRERPAHGAKAAHRKPDRPAAPAGTTAIPAAGLRVYCAGRKTPLLVRKFTQGSGTSVTVVCR